MGELHFNFVKEVRQERERFYLFDKRWHQGKGIGRWGKQCAVMCQRGGAGEICTVASANDGGRYQDLVAMCTYVSTRASSSTAHPQKKDTIDFTSVSTWLFPMPYKHTYTTHSIAHVLHYTSLYKTQVRPRLSGRGVMRTVLTYIGIWAHKIITWFFQYSSTWTWKHMAGVRTDHVQCRSLSI